MNYTSGMSMGKRGGGGRGHSQKGHAPNANATQSQDGGAAEDMWLNTAVVLQTEQDLLYQWLDNMNPGVDRDAYYHSF